MNIIWVKLIILKFCTTQDYIADDVVLIWQLIDDVIVDDVDTLDVKKWLVVSHRNISIVNSQYICSDLKEL
jgi:hypothetical protein